jgi:hypothetical protein
VDPRAGLDTKEKREISCRCRESNPVRQTHSLVIIQIKLFRLISLLQDCVSGHGLMTDSHHIFIPCIYMHIHVHANKQNSAHTLREKETDVLI